MKLSLNLYFIRYLVLFGYFSARSVCNFGSWRASGCACVHGRIVEPAELTHKELAPYTPSRCRGSLVVCPVPLYNLAFLALTEWWVQAVSGPGSLGYELLQRVKLSRYQPLNGLGTDWRSCLRILQLYKYHYAMRIGSNLPMFTALAIVQLRLTEAHPVVIAFTYQQNSGLVEKKHQDIKYAY